MERRAARSVLALAMALLAGFANAEQLERPLSGGESNDPGDRLRVEIEGELVSVWARDVSIEAVIERIAANGNVIVMAGGPTEERLTLDLRRLPMAIAFKKILRNQNYVLHQARPGSNSYTGNLHSVTRLWIFSDRPWSSSTTDLPVRHASRQARDRLGLLRRKLTDGDKGARIEAASEIGEIGDAEATGTLTSAMVDADPVVREEIVYGLREIGSPSAVRAIMGALSDPEPRVRQAAIEAFADIGGEEATGALEVALTFQEKSLRVEAVQALGEIGGETAKLLLERALSDPEETVREAASEYLADL